MPRRAPSLLLSFAVLTAGLLSAYYLLHANGWSGQADLQVVWNHFSVQSRLFALASWTAIVYGTAGILKWLLTRWAPR